MGESNGAVQALAAHRAQISPLGYKHACEDGQSVSALPSGSDINLLGDGEGTLWLAWSFFLDPTNRRVGAPSLLADWAAGKWGRTLALMAAGATCGFLWEFWNCWAAAKWT